MANEIKMAIVESIFELRTLRWSARRIARHLGIDRGTVRKYLRRANSVPKPAIFARRLTRAIRRCEAIEKQACGRHPKREPVANRRNRNDNQPHNPGCSNFARSWLILIRPVTAFRFHEPPCFGLRQLDGLVFYGAALSTMQQTAESGRAERSQHQNASSREDEARLLLATSREYSANEKLPPRGVEPLFSD